jgi:hypothetical protein
MPHQLHVSKPHTKQTATHDLNTGWIVGGLCLIGLAVALYFTFASGQPSFSEFASMSVFP